MTGPEHYVEAERLLAEVPAPFTDTNIVAAQVHATLALTAATAYPAILAYTGDETGAESRGWANVTAPGRVAS